ncbi:15-hydroxyprostaglandin dehydrogenase [Trichonephila clavipes]|uniref:15-hydroxyprostaglandin dehydrogenase n=1 Tax=Trichonephila clavipes TaxID=2585209 RepID=A0A8X6S1K5_TRICX|nr:15-hydroxyprostaglandin dehydrogenase [Trichonephila clavipes]
MPTHGSALSRLDTLCCPEANGPTNLEQPTLNHVQSDTMASAVLADPTRALQETNRWSGPTIEESENDVGSFEQLLLYADEHYLAGKLLLGDHLGKVLHGVEEYHQRSVDPLRRSCRCSGVKGSARKGRLDLRFASARCLKIVCGTIATPTSARILERVRGVHKCLPHYPSILSPRGFPDRSRTGFPSVGTFSCPMLLTISKGIFRTVDLANNTARRPACSFYHDDQASLKLA